MDSQVTASSTCNIFTHDQEHICRKLNKTVFFLNSIYCRQNVYALFDNHELRENDLLHFTHTRKSYLRENRQRDNFQIVHVRVHVCCHDCVVKVDKRHAGFEVKSIEKVYFHTNILPYNHAFNMCFSYRIPINIVFVPQFIFIIPRGLGISENSTVFLQCYSL